ncbi:MAG: D-alanine--D-alanine ligase [Candidatus Latescibacterota bacterium]
MRVAVLMGGHSTEREVSLATGRGITRALESIGHEVVPLDMASGEEFLSTLWKTMDKGTNAGTGKLKAPGPLFPVSEGRSGPHSAVFQISRSLPAAGWEGGADLFFIALHGGFGENGGVQSLLEMMGVPYTGSGPLSSAMAMDKDVSKRLFRQRGVPTPPWFLVGKRCDAADVTERIVGTFGFPCVVKPNDQGSTVGLTIVDEPTGVLGALALSLTYSAEALVEKYIPGRELTVAILGEEALPVVEIHPEHRVYDYACKYREGLSAYTVPAEIPKEVEREIQLQAKRAFCALKCRGYGRVDFRFDPKEGLFCLEVNSLPGMTETSLVPKAARAAGLSFEQLMGRIIELAI